MTPARRNVFMDTEFSECGRKDRVRLLSIALVAEDGPEFYAETEEDRSLVNPWVAEHVVPQLTGPIQPYPEIAQGILRFLGNRESTGVETRLWAYFGAYDFVLYCQIFGTMINLPKGFPFFCWDLKQLASMLQIPKAAFPRQPEKEHHALHDARWNRDLYRQMKRLGADARNGAIKLDF